MNKILSIINRLRFILRQTALGTLGFLVVAAPIAFVTLIRAGKTQAAWFTLSEVEGPALPCLLFYLNFFFAGNIHKKCHNCKKGCGNLKPGNVVCQINHNISSSFSSAKIARFQNIIAPSILKVNTAKSLVTGIAAIKTTTRFEQTAEKTFNCAEVMVNISKSVSALFLFVNLKSLEFYNGYETF